MQGKKYAGKTKYLSGDLAKKYPKGVKYNISGFPDFTPYSILNIKVKGMVGKNSHDFALANKIAGFTKGINKPKGYTWHHHEDGITMMLVPTDLHSKIPHTGGAAWLRKNK